MWFFELFMRLIAEVLIKRTIDRLLDFWERKL